MRKSSWWMILVGLLTITAPTAFADSFSIDFTVFPGGGTTPVDTSISVPSTGILDLGTVTDGATTFTFINTLSTTPTPQSDIYTWAISHDFFIIFDATAGSATSSSQGSGPYILADSGTASVTLNTVAAPEPSPVFLTLIGMGLLVVMRKRKAPGLAQTT